MRDHFGIRLGFEPVPRVFQTPFMGQVIFNNAVVHDDDVSGTMGMGVLLGRFAMRGPSRMPDPDRSGEMLFFQGFFQVKQFADASTDLDPAMLQHRNPRRIIAAILQPPQALHEHAGGIVVPDISYNSTHALFVTLMAPFLHHL